ncbi:MAG: 50S ribosomal protein L13 [Candidatus Paceibacterota bacterium]|jgi:large subunit ribosomal protein L13|nr:50S ribosomal protein L13 [Candidatus Paceibacterota bacterium]MDD4831124.1 50S ribosomal protein L13 [Candidatus Paceibacterota bacterium]MDD4875002.1 50S ribosomal protein L13 [Candidatus Paceibacterota bacterium]
MEERKTHIIDAAGKPLGRLATEITVLLRGKQKQEFAPNKDSGDFVVVKNIKQVVFSGNKFKQKTYFIHTGYIGHDREQPMSEVFEKNPGEVLKKAVSGMMPKNKLRPIQIKRLKVQ